METKRYRVRLVRELLDEKTGAVTKEETFVEVAAEGASLAYLAAKKESGVANGWSPMGYEVLDGKEPDYGLPAKGKPAETAEKEPVPEVRG